eukprot:scaffold139009_cov29-Tisochrysis_lutea.AAC.2
MVASLSFSFTDSLTACGVCFVICCIYGLWTFRPGPGPAIVCHVGVRQGAIYEKVRNERQKVEAVEIRDKYKLRGFYL